MAEPKKDAAEIENKFSLSGEDVSILKASQQSYDDEGFYPSFKVSESKQIKLFFDTHGFVVIRDVLSTTDIDNTLASFWDKPELDKDDPNTWEPYWNKQQFGKLGIIGSMYSFDAPLMANRQNPNVHKAYSIIHNTTKLWVDYDRLGVLRPTRNVKFPEKSEPVDMPSWKTKDRWLHTDCNPSSGKIDVAGFKKDRNHPHFKQGEKLDFEKTLYVQGLLTLTDARVQDGGFHCVPGSHKLPHILLEVPSAGGNVQLPENHPVRDYIQKVSMRKGSLVIWNSLTFHANYPNDSERFRVVQYVRMYPNSGRPYLPLAQEEGMAEIILDEFKPSDLGKKVFGLKRYYWPW